MTDKRKESAEYIAMRDLALNQLRSGKSLTGAIIRPDCPELKEWPYFWQQTEYIFEILPIILIFFWSKNCSVTSFCLLTLASICSNFN